MSKDEANEVEVDEVGAAPQATDAGPVRAEDDAEGSVTDAAENVVEPEPEREVKVVDKRRFARILGFGGKSNDEADKVPEERRTPTYVAQLEQQLEQVRARAAQAEAQSKAEIEAARQRLERHFENRLATSRAETIAAMLGVFDNLERALEVQGARESPLFEGLSATRDLFLKQLAELGAELVPAEGEEFDPEIHEAVEQVPVDDEALDHRVVGVLQRGFTIGGRLVRPAVVRVGRRAEGGD